MRRRRITPELLVSLCVDRTVRPDRAKFYDQSAERMESSQKPKRAFSVRLVL